MWDASPLSSEGERVVRDTEWSPCGSGARFEEMLFASLKGGIVRNPVQLTLGIAPKEEIIKAFQRTWTTLREEMELAIDSGEALKRMADLVLYDVPDGTRSTLSVKEEIEIGEDAGLFCTALIHTLNSLGARKAIMMTHTSYNRLRGAEGTHRFIKLIHDGLGPLTAYARANDVNLRFVGMGANYELNEYLEQVLPKPQPANFDAIFLTDYHEDYFLQEGKEYLPMIPEVDVCIRHTKMSMGGGWIPQRMLKSTFVYCQNGSLFSNWRYDELGVLAAVSLAAKLFHSGEGLSKVYGDVDEVKRRHQMRELRLFYKTVELSPKPRKLFIVGSPIGLYRVMA